MNAITLNSYLDLRYEYLITVWECQVIKFISRRPLEIKDFSTDIKMNLTNAVCLSHPLHIFAGIIDYLRYGVFCFEKKLMVNFSFIEKTFIVR